jgi:hypothetical protein
MVKDYMTQVTHILEYTPFVKSYVLDLTEDDSAQLNYWIEGHGG